MQDKVDIKKKYLIKMLYGNNFEIIKNYINVK